MHVLFVEPAFPRNQREFVRGLARAGASVTGIGERPVQFLDDELKSWMVGYEQVPSVVHEPSLLAAVQRVQARGWVDRLEATVEAHVLAAARVREATGIPGTSERTAWLCRDKPAMKEALREAGVACARSTGADTPGAVRAFVAEVGYPVILKPRAAAGSAGTYRVEDDDGLERVLAETGVGRGGSVAVEEFIEGHEAFYDTLAVDGEPVHDFVTHYYPGVLEAMRTRWISPVFVVTNRVDDAEAYGEVRALGRKVIDALGIRTSATHMEWFFGDRGLSFSEIGCRPPGVGTWDLYCAANEMDLYAEWGRAVTHGRTAERPTRRYSAGMVNLRPERDGTITGYSGIEDMQAAIGEWILDTHFPPPGSPTQPVDAGFMANAWVRLRHPDYDVLREMLTRVGETVRVHAR